MPRISVCIPLYNGERYIEACLESVAAQSFGDLEILLVDDGSTDATPGIARRFAARERRARFVRNERNLGLVGNWNRCAELAGGEWVKFVFQDDLVQPECLRALHDAATASDLLVACERSIVFEDGTDAPVRRMYLNHKQELHALFGQARIGADAMQAHALRRFGVNPLGEPTCVMIRRSAFARYGGFHPMLAGSCDLEYWLRVGVNTGVAVVREELATFRVHRSATSAHNLSRGYYRATTVDNLVLLHDFLHVAHYAPLRAKARAMGIDLAAMLRHRKNEARAIAEWARQPPGRDLEPLQALKAVTDAYPALRSGTLSHAIWRVRNRLATRDSSASARTRDSGQR